MINIKNIFKEEKYEENTKIYSKGTKMVLDNLSEWWGLYFSCEQEKIEYDKLEEVRTKLNELILMREEYLTLKRSDK